MIVLAKSDPVRLNIGAWGTRIPGFKSVDIRPETEPDIVSDMGNLSQIKSDSVFEIYASNVLEHAPRPKTVPVLKEWRRVLVPGGKLMLSVPDFEVVIRGYPRVGLNEYLENLIWGEQNGPHAFHYIMFTWATLRESLDAAGFSRVDRARDLPYGLKDSSTLIDTHARLPTAINCIAIK